MLFITPLSRRLVRSGMESRRFEMMAGFFDERGGGGGRGRAGLGEQTVHVVDPEPDPFHVKRRDGPGERFASSMMAAVAGSGVALRDRDQLGDLAAAA